MADALSINLGLPAGWFNTDVQLLGRAQDLDDLRSMRPRPDELRFVESYLDALAAAGEPADHVIDARAVLRMLQERSDGH